MASRPAVNRQKPVELDSQLAENERMIWNRTQIVAEHPIIRPG